MMTEKDFKKGKLVSFYAFSAKMLKRFDANYFLGEVIRVKRKILYKKGVKMLMSYESAKAAIKKASL